MFGSAAFQSAKRPSYAFRALSASPRDDGRARQTHVGRRVLGSPVGNSAIDDAFERGNGLSRASLRKQEECPHVIVDVRWAASFAASS
jgi:hypothetical protein